MRAVIQRVTQAAVKVEGEIIGRIGPGLVVLLGIAKGDDPSDVDYLTDKLLTLRIFNDDQGKMNRSIMEIGGAMLVVSQFTLLGDVRKGRRPGFDQAASPTEARALYDLTVQSLRAKAVSVETGRFGATMNVTLENDGPVTFVLDSRREPIPSNTIF